MKTQTEEKVMTLALSIDYSRITMNTMGPPTGQHLLVNTFGIAILYQGDEELARSDGGIMPAIGTNDFDYRVRVNASGAFDIQRRTRTPVVPINLLIEDSQGPIVHLNVTSDAIVIPPRYHISRNTLTQNFSLLPQPAFGGGFRIQLLASNVLRRIDMRYLNHSWVTVLISARRVLAIRLQGEEMAEVLYEICTRISTFGASDGNNDYGLRPAPRARSRQPSPSQTNARHGGMANQTPAPIPRSRPSSPARRNVRPDSIPMLEAYIPETSLVEDTVSPMQIHTKQDQSVVSSTPISSPIEMRETGTIPKIKTEETKNEGEREQVAGPSGLQMTTTPKNKSGKKIKEIAKLLASEIVHQWASICSESDEEEGEIKEE